MMTKISALSSVVSILLRTAMILIASSTTSEALFNNNGKIADHFNRKKNKNDKPRSSRFPGLGQGMDNDNNDQSPTVVLSMDIDYPPFAYLGPAADDFPLAGFGPDFALGLEEVCDLDIQVMQAHWSDCWGSEEIGAGLLDSWYQGCMTYTHTAGVRNRYLEFSTPILNDNQPAGIIVRLNELGEPDVVDGSSNLNNIRVVDVVGWAPTADTLALVVNPCTNEQLTGYTIVDSTYNTGSANDDALLSLLNGEADALWIYASQAEQYSCSNLPENEDVPYNCDLWDGLGVDFAYIQTGISEHIRAGTTLSISKMGSGVASILDPCIEEFVTTESYYDLCVKHGLVDSCFVNEFFPDSTSNTNIYRNPTNELTTTCSDGYCSCPA